MACATIMQEHISVFEILMMIKSCSKCFQKKEEKDFYVCKGYPRKECKKCTVKRNVEYQRINETWKNRFVDKEQSRSYMIEYYSNNRDKFREYRLKHKEKSNNS